jgi:hypothetical protein
MPKLMKTGKKNAGCPEPGTGITIELAGGAGQASIASITVRR